ncbi:hypothetical protein AVEN_42651-1 [Araneus ventricosus]|uniref:Uncharacterized protein n=1 Tax=Araneus ventricosus TaxID=182803 RepID=A0A4Y2BNL5_ARAVE|nr:hypothetical protein AVEN_42651-1 [Araneus ventricosus]
MDGLAGVDAGHSIVPEKNVFRGSSLSMQLASLTSAVMTDAGRRHRIRVILWFVTWNGKNGPRRLIGASGVLEKRFLVGQAGMGEKYGICFIA